MVKERIVSLTWLRKHIEQADTNLLREMVKNDGRDSDVS